MTGNLGIDVSWLKEHVGDREKTAVCTPLAVNTYRFKD